MSIALPFRTISFVTPIVVLYGETSQMCCGAKVVLVDNDVERRVSL